ncbi:MAG: branched-chain amino acid ABC transporter substrate-binding protein [Planctomycetales bacterium]|nr:branched-chain amino acid ABC transporter substrate-binding protein [Planctomycetales bacterium]
MGRELRRGPFGVIALAAAALLAGGGLGSGCGPKGRPGIVKIVSSLPMQGSSLGQTQTIVDGIRMAIEEAGGKVGSFTIEYEPWDDASAQKGSWDETVEAENARRAVNDPDVLVYIGTFNSGAAKVAAPILNREGLLMISPANTWPGLTKPGNWDPGEPGIYRPSGKLTYFRVVPADDIQGPVSAAWAQELGVKSVYILHDQETYGKGIAEIVRRECEKRGIAVKGFDGIDKKAPEYRSLMTKVKGTDPDLVYFGGITQNNAGQLVKDMVAVGVRAEFMGPDGVYEKAFIEAAGAANANNRCYITFGGIPPKNLTGKGKVFYDTFVAKFKKEPEGYAVYGYEAAKVALEAIRRAGKEEREAVRAGCAGIRDFDGMLGKWSFDANGDTSLKFMSCNIVKNGELEFVKLMTVD